MKSSKQWVTDWFGIAPGLSPVAPPSVDMLVNFAEAIRREYSGLLSEVAVKLREDDASNSCEKWGDLISAIDEATRE